MIMVYFSPSNQTQNAFFIDSYNESSYATALCKKISKRISAVHGHPCIVSDVNTSLRNRVKDANESVCSLYVAVHTRFSFDSTVKGTVCYYHPQDKNSQLLAVNMADALTKLCHIPPSDDKTIADGTLIYGKLRLTEIQLPYEVGITAVLVEVNAHDNPKTCQWLVESIDEIAECLSKTIIDFLQMT